MAKELVFVDLEIEDPLGGQDLVQSINTTGVAQIDGLGADPTIDEPVDPAARDMSGEHPNGADSWFVRVPLRADRSNASTQCWRTRPCRT